MTYTNAARAGRTHHGMIERRTQDDPKFSIQVGPGFRVRARSDAPPNRRERRSYGRYAGVTVGSPYRRVLSLRTLGTHPGQIAARRAAIAELERVAAQDQAA